MLRVGRQKLGIEVATSRRIGDKTHDRGDYILTLADYEVTDYEGKPSVPQDDTSMTQYIELQYTSDPAVLFPAASKGSLCSQVFLDSKNIPYDIED